MPNRSTTRDDGHDKFMRLFLGSQSEIFRYVLAIVPNHDDAQEIVQETAIALWAKFDDYDPSVRFEPWACRFAMIQIKRYRREKSRAPMQFDDAVIALIANDYHACADEMNAQRSALARCLQKLRSDDRALVDQHYYQRNTIQQIAEETSRSVHTLYKSMQRIRKQLLRCVNRGLSEELA
jgi:RNA polymerase sigma-70 factor (ECF subfamily)